MQITQNITFHHRQEMIHPFLQEVARFLETYLRQPNGAIIFKAKVIVTELLTNSIKHAGHGSTDIHLSLTADTFTITKTDSGKPFTLGAELLQWPCPLPANTVIKIYADSLNGLFARLTSPYSLVFFTEDYDEDRDIIADMAEHYGLMIICRAADIFTYQFNYNEGVNTFTASIAL